MNDSLSPVDSDEMEMEPDISLANLANLDVTFLPNVAIAEPAPDIPSIDNTTTTIVPGSNSDSNSNSSNNNNSNSPIIERILAPIPSDALTSAAQAAKIVSAVVKPVPWLGPATELVAAIVTLCQNVGKNRGAAAKLAGHCQKLLDALNETFRDSSKDSMNSMLHDLIGLLNRIKKKTEKWTSNDMSFFGALVKQNKIADAIMTFHVEIDQFCKRYTIVTQTLMINWAEVHEKQSKADMEEIRMLFATSENRRILENACLTERLDYVIKALGIIQRLMLQPHWQAAQRTALKENFVAMCHSSGELPPDVELHEDLLDKPEFPIRGNGTFDIYRGTCLGRSCAIKVLRRVAYSANTRRRFERQFRHWKAVYARDRGRHILPLIGAVFRVDENPYLCFVSPWMENGNALQYVKNTDGVDRINLIRRIAEGVQVLHTYDPPLVHGFLKSSNILIDDFGKPLIADFGLLRVIEKENFQANSCPDAVTAYRWCAPEMISDGQPTAKTDVYMFGMTVLEIMTHEKPFAHIRRDPSVLVAMGRGERPLRPQNEQGAIVRRRGLDDQLWTLLTRCWSEGPRDRPTITDVLLELETLPPPEED